MYNTFSRLCVRINNKKTAITTKLQNFKAVIAFFRMKPPTVTVSTGTLRGKIGNSSNSRQFYSFQGIPYAKPPIGHLRFKAPLPAEPWSGVRDATHEGDDCIHKNPILRSLQGSEDCLTLNVYTPTLPDDKMDGKPVMVWIHGGGFTSGSGSTEIYGPEFLMTEDIVLVTINYRTGILGFLTLEDPHLNVPGNAGLKDMVMALKWVQNNITYFGGNPNNVTIFGESAGAAASHYLILSPLAKGLFHKAILQSGCALNIWAKGRNCSSELSQLLGLKSSNEKDVLEALVSLPIKELYGIVEKIPDRFIASTMRPHGPVIEKKIAGAFLYEDPRTIIKSGNYNHVPIVIGYTTREGMLSEVFQKPKPFRPITDFEQAIPYSLKLKPKSDASKLVAKQIKEFYYGNETPSAENKDKFYLLESDNFFVRELLEAIKLHTETMSCPIFLYRMSIETSLNMMKTIFAITEPGVCHADDLGYLFKNIMTPEIEPGSIEDIAKTRFVKLWTNFAKHGNPNSRETNSVVNVVWEPATKTKINFLDIGKKLTTGTDPESARMNFWKDILNINATNKL